MNNKNFGIIIIGDEILNGKRTDKHLPHVLDKLKKQGLSLAWCRYVSDNEKILTEHLQQSQDDGIPVFCFGGIGATPDDKTRQAAANAFNVDLTRHPEALELIKEKFGPTAYPNRVLMADLPDDAIIIPNAFNNIPGFTLFEHHFFPGFPQMAWPMLDWVFETYYPNKHEQENEESVRIFDTPESELIELLEYFVEKYPKLKVFSLPSMTNSNSIEIGFRGEGVEPSRALNELVSNLTCSKYNFYIGTSRMNNSMHRPVVLYDGGCPLCSREINHYQRIDKKHAIQWCDISINEYSEILGSLNIQWQEAMKHMHVIDHNGKIVKGAYAFKEMWLNLPYYRWPGQLLRIPLITPILNVFYNGFASLRWRSRKGEVCNASCAVDVKKTK